MSRKFSQMLSYLKELNKVCRTYLLQCYNSKIAEISNPVLLMPLNLNINKSFFRPDISLYKAALPELSKLYMLISTIIQCLLIQTW